MLSHSRVLVPRGGEEDIGRGDGGRGGVVAWYVELLAEVKPLVWKYLLVEGNEIINENDVELKIFPKNPYTFTLTLNYQDMAY